MDTYDVIIKCKSRAQAIDIAEHFIGDRPSEEFLNDRLFESSGECIDNVEEVDYQKDIIIVNLI